MNKINNAIQAIPDSICRLIIVGQIEGRQLEDIYIRVKQLDPNLTREQFDLRVISCRQEFWNRLEELG